MAKNLLIVESPAKAKTIEKILGKDFEVKSCYGHIRDLEKDEMGIDVNNNFEPRYIVPDEKERVVKDLKALAKDLEIKGFNSMSKPDLVSAIQAVKEAGLQPGKDILIVSVDAVDDALKSIVSGEINVSVELSPHLGGPAFDVIDEARAGKKDFEKWIRMGGAVFTQENAAAELAKRGAK